MFFSRSHAGAWERECLFGVVSAGMVAYTNSDMKSILWIDNNLL